MTQIYDCWNFIKFNPKATRQVTLLIGVKPSSGGNPCCVNYCTSLGHKILGFSIFCLLIYSLEYNHDLFVTRKGDQNQWVRSWTCPTVLSGSGSDHFKHNLELIKSWEWTSIELIMSCVKGFSWTSIQQHSESFLWCISLLE